MKRDRGGIGAVLAGGGTWDEALMRACVRPFVGTWLRPNHITSLRLLSGLVAAALAAVGDATLLSVGAGLFIFSNMIDHADGELARLGGHASRFGHLYDLASDAVVQICFFVALGCGLRESVLGGVTVWLGILSGVSIGLLFWLFGQRGRMFGREGLQPRFWGFDLEDVLYLAAPVIWLGGALPLLVAAAIGAPLAAMILMWQQRQVLFGRPRQGEPS